MTLDEVLTSLFPLGHAVERGPSGTLHGTAKVENQGGVMVIGIVDGAPRLASTVRSCWLVMSWPRWRPAAARRSSSSSIRQARTRRAGTSCWG
jgi:hypothetical protein